MWTSSRNSGMRARDVAIVVMVSMPSVTFPSSILAKR